MGGLTEAQIRCPALVATNAASILRKNFCKLVKEISLFELNIPCLTAKLLILNGTDSWHVIRNVYGTGDYKEWLPTNAKATLAAFKIILKG